MKRILLFIITSIIPLGFVHASGIQVSPARLDFSLPPNGTVTKEIVAANPTANVQLFEIYPDDFEGSVTVSPSSFTLEAGDRKKISITVKAQALKKDQAASTSLSITSKPLAEQSLTVGTGIKIPLTITVNSSSRSFPVPSIKITITAATAVIIAGGLAYLAYKKRKKPKTP